MSAEFELAFEDRAWPEAHLDRLLAAIARLPTFTRRVDDELWLKCPGSASAWAYDVRVIVARPRVMLEISAHPPAIERDLAALLGWLRRETAVTVADEDGEPSRW
jgi:hypothetical protein